MQINRPIKITFLGLRGVPEVQGGVETHVQNLCPLLVESGCNVEVICRSGYHPSDISHWRGVTLKRIWAPKSKGLEAIVHSFLGVLYAGLIARPDILHIQAIGPALMTPLARVLGLRVVVTHHGPDYDRQKWGGVGKAILRLGERLGMLFANERIVISKLIATIVFNKYDRSSFYIPNGVNLPVIPTSQDALKIFNLDAGKYIILVGRLVPEKRHIDLIRAFNEAAIPGWKLVIVGASDHPDVYVSDLLSLVSKFPNIVCTGLQRGRALEELYGHAGIFVLPSSHEGLPIALLEALSYGLPAIVSDIPANLEVGLGVENYFPLGNIGILAEKLGKFSRNGITPEGVMQRRNWVGSRFNWVDIANQTLRVYEKAIQ